MNKNEQQFWVMSESLSLASIMGRAGGGERGEERGAERQAGERERPSDLEKTATPDCRSIHTCGPKGRKKA